MIVVAYLVWGLILAIVAIVAVAVVVGAWAVKDSLAVGDRSIRRAMDEMEAARNVTGRTSR